MYFQYLPATTQILLRNLLCPPSKKDGGTATAVCMPPRPKPLELLLLLYYYDIGDFNGELAFYVWPS